MLAIKLSDLLYAPSTRFWNTVIQASRAYNTGTEKGTQMTGSRRCVSANMQTIRGRKERRFMHEPVTP